MLLIINKVNILLIGKFKSRFIHNVLPKYKRTDIYVLSEYELDQKKDELPKSSVTTQVPPLIIGKHNSLLVLKKPARFSKLTYIFSKLTYIFLKLFSIRLPRIKIPKWVKLTTGVVSLSGIIFLLVWLDNYQLSNTVIFDKNPGHFEVSWDWYIWTIQNFIDTYWPFQPPLSEHERTVMTADIKDRIDVWQWTKVLNIPDWEFNLTPRQFWRLYKWAKTNEWEEDNANILNEKRRKIQEQIKQLRIEKGLTALEEEDRLRSKMYEISDSSEEEEDLIEDFED